MFWAPSPDYILTWAANCTLIVGQLLIGRKWRHAPGVIALGEVVWFGVGVYRAQWDIAFICAVFGLLAAVNWFQWACLGDKGEGGGRG
jgi:hypothetical protein